MLIVLNIYYIDSVCSREYRVSGQELILTFYLFIEEKVVSDLVLINLTKHVLLSRVFFLEHVR